MKSVPDTGTKYQLARLAQDQAGFLPVLAPGHPAICCKVSSPTTNQLREITGRFPWTEGEPTPAAKNYSHKIPPDLKRRKRRRVNVIRKIRNTHIFKNG
jgi:hypothetical protein